VNVANAPIYVDGDGSPGSAESWLRNTLYTGYPQLESFDPSSGTWTGIFPALTNNDGVGPVNDQVWEDAAGRFLSELNLVGAVREWLSSPAVAAVGGDPAEAVLLNAGADLDSDGTLDVPGRYGFRSPPDVLPYAQYSNPAAVPAKLVPLLGDPATGDPGRFGEWFAYWLANGSSLWDLSDQTTWRTYDPDGLARRIASPPTISSPAAEQDRPFGIDEAFDLLSLHGLFFDSAANQLRYRTSGLPAKTRLEQLWPTLLDNTDGYSVQWRTLLTGYSWSLNFCPYGEDPYDDDSFRKVNLNTCTPEEFRAALEAANRHASYGKLTSTWQIDQLAANFADFRDRQLNAEELAKYLAYRLTMLQAGQTPQPPGGNLVWNQALWDTYWPTAGPGGGWAPPPDGEREYLEWLFGRPADAFRTEIDKILTQGRVSVDKPQRLAAGGDRIGYERHPFIVEVWMNINYPDDVAEPYDPAHVGDPNYINNYAVELYNPWDTHIFLDGWYLRISGTPADHEVALSSPSNPKVIPPGGRFVIARLTGAPGSGADLLDPDLVIATQTFAGTGPTIDLVYRFGGDQAVYDTVGGAWTKEFSGDAVKDNGIPANRSIIRRDDSGFWCYQRWAESRNDSGALESWLGEPVSGSGGPNSAYWNYGSGPNVGRFMFDDPWDVTVYGPNPAVPVCDVGLFLSPAELALVPFRVPEESLTSTWADAITPFLRSEDGMPNTSAGPELPQRSDLDRLRNLRVPWPMLFHRAYTDVDPAGAGPTVDQTANLAGVLQALMDFVTVVDFTADGVDNDGNGTADGTGDNLRAELRIPGRLNLNTVADWYSLDQLNLLVNVPRSWPAEQPPTPLQLDLAFWRRLLAYRDKRDPATGSLGWYGPANQRRNRVAQVPAVPQVRDATTASELEAFLGFEQLGEICNVQDTTEEPFEGFWEDRDIDGDGTPDIALLPAQHIRRFARNANMLSVRSDTYMVTMRVQIVRPIYIGATPDRVEVLGEREYMYLMDRSYCIKPPQNDSAGQWNPDFIPPRVWRMAVPRYLTY